MSDGMAAVQARIAEIQSRFPSSGLSVVRTPATRSAAATAGAGGFSTALAEASRPAASPSASPAAAPTVARPAVASPAASPAAVRGAAPASRSAAGVTGEDVVASARKYLGVPYKWGGTDPKTGLDCSGMIQRAYADLGISLPRVSRDQAKAGTPVASLAEARPGDLIAFGRPVDHIGIYVGDGKMLAAPRRGDVVKIQDVYRTPTAIRRILPETAAAQAPQAVAPAGAPGRGEAAFAPLFAAAGARHGVSPALLTAVARAESGFNPAARSPAGAQGLMQFMPATARGLGIDPWNPEQAVDGAARLLKQHLERFGSTELALAAYNAGPGAVTKHGGIPPYRETENYVRKIMSELRAEAA